MRPCEVLSRDTVESRERSGLQVPGKQMTLRSGQVTESCYWTKTYRGSFTSVVIRDCKLRFSLHPIFFSATLVHSFLKTRSRTSTHWTGYVVGGLNSLQLLKTNSTSRVNSSVVEYFPELRFCIIVPKSIGFLISSKYLRKALN